MVAPVRYLSRRDLQNKIGILDFSEDTTVLEVIGRVGIGSTIFDADYNLDVRGDAFIQELTLGQLNVNNASFDNLIVTGVSTFISSVFANNDVYIGRNLDVTSGRTDLDVLTVSGISSFSSNVNIGGFVDVGGKVIVGSGLSVIGVSTFLSAVDIRSDVTITGFTEVDDFRALGPSVFNADVDVNAPIEVTGRIDAYSFANFTDSINVDGHTELDNINVSGVSTFLDTVNVVSSLSVSDDLSVSGISTFLNSIDADGNLDVDGVTSLDLLNVSELATFSSDIDANGNLDVEGHTELDDLNVSGVSTFASNLDINASVDIAGYLNVDGQTELDDLSVSGVSTFLSNLDIDGSIDVDGHTELDDLSVSGVSTFLSDANILGNVELSSNFIVSGVSTFISTIFSNSDLEVAGYLNVDGHTELDNLNVSGVSTFAGTADFNGDLEVAGYLNVDGHTELDNLNVSGVSTFAGTADFNGDIDVDGHTELDNLNVSGVSTFASNVKIQGELHGPEEFIIDPSAVGDNTGLVRIKGDLYVDGTEFIVNSTTIQLADFKVGIATTVGTNLLLDGAGIGIGSTNIEKTFTYNNTSNTLESSIGLGVTSGGEFKTGTDSVLNRITLGPTVTNSSLTSLGTLNSLNVSGVSTFSSNIDVNSSVDISDNLIVGFGLTVSGVSTFAGTADFNGDIDVDGHTELDNLNVSGVSTFAGTADFNGDIDVDGHTELDNLNVSGVSTFAGTADFNGDINVDGHTELDTLNVSVAATIANLTLANIGIAVTAILDEDDMISNRDDALATQQSIKAYVDSRPDPDLRFAGNIGIGTIDIDNDTFNIIGITNEIETVGYGTTLTIGLPDNVFITTSLTVGTATTISDSGIIAGIITGTLDNTLTLNTSGVGITGFATYNNSGISTFTVTSNATNLNTAGTIVSRDGSGNFSAGTITADLTGTATTATQLETPRTFQITGDVVASPISFDGTGNVSLAATIQPNSVELGTDTFGNYVATIEDSGNSDIDISNSGTETAPVTLGLTTTGVTPGTYGSSIEIPTFTVDSRGRLTFADTFAVGVALTVSGDSGSETIGLLTEILTISGGTNLNSSANLNTVTINLDNNISLTSVNATGVITATGGFVGDLTGTATTATQLETPRTFQITGDVVASPISFDGTGNVSLAATIQPNSVALGTDTFGNYVATIADAGDTDIVVNNSGTETAAVTLGLTTTGVTAGTYGSSTQIPTFTVDSRGRLTAAAVVQSVGAALTVAGDSGLETIDLSTETLTISGGTNLTSSAASDTVTINLDDYISLTGVNATGVVTATSFVGDLTGTATTATQLETPRTFQITGDVVASPISFDGTGNVSLAATIQPNSVALGTDTFGNYVATIADAGDTDIVVNNSGTETAAITLGLTTTGVTTGSYGSSIEIPTFTVDSRGRLTAAGSTFVGVALTVSGDTGTETINFLSETLTISGGTNLTSSAASDTVTINLDDNISVVSIGASNINATGVVTATTFVGSFIGDLTGTATTATNLSDGANITTGTINDDRLPDLITSNININSGVSTFSTVNATSFVGDLTGTATTATQLETPRTFQITGDVVASPISFDGTGNVSLAATIQPNSVALGTDTFGDYVETVSGTIGEIVVTGGTGEGSNPIISISPNPTLTGNATITGDLQVDGNVNVDGNITIGGTSGFIIVQNFRVSDANLVLGFTTDSFNNEVSTDVTANSGGISIASTEGNPLVLLDTDEGFDYNYKNILWYQAGSFAGLNTDAWLFNYAVGIGSTQFPSGTRLAAGSVQFTENDLAVVRNINASGVITATNFVGNLTGTASTASFATTAFTLNGTLEQDLSVAFAQTSTNLLGGVAGNVPYQSATDTTTFVSNGAAGQVLLFNGSVPVWSDVSAASNAFTGISVYEEGVLVGFSQGITALNFVSPNLTAVGPNTTGIATITLSDNLTVGFATFSGDVSIGSSITMDATTGIISATAFYGSGENLIDVIAAKIDGIDVKEEGTLVNDQVTSINFVGDYVTATTGLTTTSVNITFTTPPYADNAGISTSVIGGIGSITSLTVSGISTFSSTIDANGDLDVDGHTELDNLNVSGIATFVSIETTSDVSIGSSLLVSGITTSTGGFVGDLTGTATNATSLETPRTFEITGDVVASPIIFDGSGNVSLAATIQPNSVELGTDTFGNYVATIADSGDTDIVVNNSGTETASVTLGLTTTGVTTGSYGSATQIPTFTVDSRGRLTAVGTTTIGNVGASLTVSADTGTEIISLGLETLTISGGTNLTSSAASDTVTINLDDYISLTGVNATGVITATSFDGNASTATALETPRTFEITGDVVASPISFDGSGNVSFAATIQPNSVELGTDTFGNYVATIADAGDTDIVVNNSGTETAAITLGLTTTGVTAGSYGSSIEIPTFTVDSRGRLTVANSSPVGVALTVSADTGTETINFLSETLTITGGTNLTSSAASDTVTINLDDYISLTGVNATGVITATTFDGNLSGNADTATALETARDFSISGDASASAVSFDGTSNVGFALTLATVNSNVGTFGSQNQIPVVTVNAKGLVTAVSTASVGSALTVSGDTGSETINLASEFLTISGGTNLTSSAASDTITINLDDNISLTSVNATGIITASEFRTGTTGSAIGITTNTISGPAVLNIDPSGIGDNTGLVVIKGDLQVDGTETIINSTSVTINDKNIQIADGAINDAAADGAGITVNSGDGNKTFQFVDVDNSFRANINLDVTSGNVYKINGTEVLSSTTLGSGVVNSSLTSVGTLGQLNVSGIVTAPSFDGDLSGNATTANRLTTSRVIGLSGDLSGSANFDGSSNITISATIQPNSVALGNDTVGNYVATIADSGSTDIAVNNSGTETAAITLGLTVTGVTTGSYGSATQIPTFTVDSRGRLTAANSFPVGVALTVSGDTGTETINFLSETLTISGGTNLTSSAASDTVTINLDDYISLTGVNATGVITATSFDGNASTATALETPRTFEITGDIIASPISFNGSGNVSFAATIQPNSVALGTDTFGNYVATIADAGDTDIVVNNSGTETAAVTLGLTTTGVTAGTYGSALQIPTFTVDSRGRLTSIGVSDIQTGTGVSLTVAGDSGLETIDLSTETLTISGGTNLTSSAASDTVTINLDDYISLTGVNATGVITATSFDGNASTATALQTGRTITLSGDVSGSATFDGSANITITSTVADDSHNHTIANIDGLQGEIDSKLDSVDYNASDILSKLLTVDGTGSGLDADLLDGQDSTYFLNTSSTAQTKSGDLRIGGSTYNIAIGLNNTAASGTVGHTATYNEGIFWHSSNTDYGIYRTSGAWTASNYQQLKLNWPTGIELDGGTAYGKSGVNISAGDFKVGGTTVINSSRQLNNVTYQGNTIWHSGNDGSGSTLDADLLDGQQGSYYRNASNINAGTIDDAYLPATISSNITGNAATATRLVTARSISLGGDLSGSTSFNGSSNVTISATIQPNSVALGNDTTGDYVATIVDAGNGNITVTNSGTESAAVTLDLTNTTVTSGSYGSSTQVPTFTVDSKGRLTAAGSVAVSTPTAILTVAGDTGSEDIDLGTETLTITGGNNLTSSAASNTVIVNLDNNISVTSVSATGTISASSFSGDGSSLTGIGITIFNTSTANTNYYPLFTDASTGSVSTIGVSAAKLTYNPADGELTAVNFNSTSDVNLKTNIKTVQDPLYIIDNLRGVSFDWKESGKGSYGVIAQELEEVLPELVNQSDIKSVNYNGIIAVLIESIKELKNEIEELKRSN